MKRYPMRNKLNIITQSELKKLLDFDPKTGIFTWKIFRGGKKSGSIAGCKDLRGYIKIQINGKSYTASRLAFLWMKGYFPEYEVDHRDRVRHNNKWKNLRHMTHQCNVKNQSIRKNNKSGVTGVSWHKRMEKWVGRITVDNVRTSLGCFDDIREAVQARWEAEIKHGYPNCNTTSSAYIYLQENN
jgi:hypothetical protein